MTEGYTSCPILKWNQGEAISKNGKELLKWMMAKQKAYHSVKCTCLRKQQLQKIRNYIRNIQAKQMVLWSFQVTIVPESTVTNWEI